MDIDAAVWSGLPFETVERVLTFLPVPDLCRHRTVCKKWNHLICNSKLGAAHALNAKLRRDASFIIMRCTHICNTSERSEKTHERWCFFDLGARRWSTLRDDHPKIPQNLYPSVAAMDGGLVCQISKTEASQRFAIVVHNPIAKTVHELPSLPPHLISDLPFAELNLVVDSISQHFKVFLINNRICASSRAGDRLKIRNEPLIRVYNSATNEWHSLTNPSCLSSRGVGSVSIVMFQGLLYAFLGRICMEFVQELWRYNLVENAWESVNVDTGSKLHFSPMLFVSANRLFLMAWLEDSSMRSDEESWRLEVSEIRISGMNRERVFEMSKADAMDVFGVKSGQSAFEVQFYPQIVASRFGNSILLLCKSSGRMMVLDLETRLWEQVPQIPARTFHGNEYIFLGKRMNLMLPSTLWWLQGGQEIAENDHSAT